MQATCVSQADAKTNCLLSLRCQGMTADNSASKSSKGTRVCIIGGGFGGLNTAIQLARLLPLQSAEQRAKITLVDSSERFVFLPLLYELVTGELKDWEVAPLFSELLQGTEIELVHGTASKIDLKSRTLQVQVAAVAGGGSKELAFDKLVVTSGAGGQLPAEAAAAGALPFYRVEDAKALRARLGQLRFETARRADLRRRAGKGARATIAIVGGGFAGVEIACSVAAAAGEWADVLLLHRGKALLQNATRFTRVSALQELQRAGVQVVTSGTNLLVY